MVTPKYNVLSDVATLISGLYCQPSPAADTYYLQAVHFMENGELDSLIKPQVKLDHRIERHLLKDEDVLFAAKGINNFAVAYKVEMGLAVASSSFIIIRLNEETRKILTSEYLVWYINHTQKVKLFHQQKIGSTIPSISMKELSTLEIVIPSLEKQNLIVQIQRLRDKERQLELQLTTQKDHLLQKQLLIAASY
jgi:restriction endonuclease S subunit